MNATALALLFASVSHTYGLPPGLLSAVCWTESHHNAAAINPDDGTGDSIGLCQVQYATARQMGYRGSAKHLRDPKTNARYAGAYIRYQLDRYDGDILKAIAGYNAGSYIVNRKGQTVNCQYVAQVLAAWQNQ